MSPAYENNQFQFLKIIHVNKTIEKSHRLIVGYQVASYNSVWHGVNQGHGGNQGKLEKV